MTYDIKQKNQKLFHLTELYKQRIRKDFLWRSVEYYGSWYESYFLLIALQCALSRWLELNVFWSGIGRPRFSSEDNCTYVFDWETQYACIDKPASCQLLSGQHLFDLSPLMRPDSMGKSLNIYNTFALCRFQAVELSMYCSEWLSCTWKLLCINNGILGW